MSDKIVVRKTDGAFFQPSMPDDYTEGQAIADALSGKARFYFRRVVPLVRKRWWPFRPVSYWHRTGEVWEPESGEFDVLDDPFA